MTPESLVARTAVEAYFFELKVIDSDDLLVMQIIGDLDIRTARHLSDFAEVAVRQKRRTAIILDMSDCSYIDSAGMAVLFAIRYKLKTLPMTLVVAAPSLPILRVLEIAEIPRFIPIAASLDEARDAIKGMDIYGCLWTAPYTARPPKEKYSVR